MTEKLEYKSHSIGLSIIPNDRKNSFTRPFLPNKGIHDTILITLEVQNGIVQTKNKHTCKGIEFT